MAWRVSCRRAGQAAKFVAKAYCIQMTEEFCAAKALAGEMNRYVGGTLERNMLAVMTAQLLAADKSRKEIEDICQFLQLLLTLLRTY